MVRDSCFYVIGHITREFLKSLLDAATIKVRKQDCYILLVGMKKSNSTYNILNKFNSIIDGLVFSLHKMLKQNISIK